MSVLTVVRHGQASFFSEHYDQLTPVGERQARLLGEYWARQKLHFDEIYTGPRSRQRRSAEIAGAALREAGYPWPDPVVLDDLDEYDLRGLLHRLAPQLASQNEEFARRAQDYADSTAPTERLRSFQRMFEMLLHHWQDSPETGLELEHWPEFRDRVSRVIGQVMARPGTGRRVALFTSGGLIGRAAQWALTAPDRTALTLNWRIRNCSLTEFVFSRERVTLDCFNAVPHLEDAALWTYR
jgi:broad specificity phosphatase PhoE